MKVYHRQAEQDGEHQGKQAELHFAVLWDVGQRYQQKSRASQGFNQRILRRDWRLAVTAAAAQQEPTQHRNVVALEHLLLAAWAVRGRPA
ncbi:hypothetical protein ACVWWB_002315 [Ewingella americana]